MSKLSVGLMYVDESRQLGRFVALLSNEILKIQVENV